MQYMRMDVMWLVMEYGHFWIRLSGFLDTSMIDIKLLIKII